MKLSNEIEEVLKNYQGINSNIALGEEVCASTQVDRDDRDLP